MAEESVFNYFVRTAQTAKAVARCNGLAAKGLVTGADTATRSLDALNKLTGAASGATMVKLTSAVAVPPRPSETV